MPNSLFDKIEQEFVQTLALLIHENNGGLNGNIADKSEYKKGWLDGYARAYTQMTGGTIWGLVEKANLSIHGSGQKLEMFPNDRREGSKEWNIMRISDEVWVSGFYSDQKAAEAECRRMNAMAGATLYVVAEQ